MTLHVRHAGWWLVALGASCAIAGCATGTTTSFNILPVDATADGGLDAVTTPRPDAARGDTSIAPDAARDVPVSRDTSPPPPDTGGAMCTSVCNTDLDCQRTCPAPSPG